MRRISRSAVAASAMGFPWPKQSTTSNTTATINRIADPRMCAPTYFIHNTPLNQKRMCSTAANTSPPPPRPCGRTRGELDDLLDRHFGTPKYELFFFKATMTGVGDTDGLVKKFSIEADDIYDRCKECGHTIAEHNASTTAPTAEAVSAELYEAVEKATLSSMQNPPAAQGLQKLTLDGDFSWLTHVEDSEPGIAYVRHVYDKVWEVVESAHERKTSSPGRHVLIVGNPGIGKSWCLNYLLWKALKMDLTPLVILRSTNSWHCFHEGRCHTFTSYPGEQWVNDRLTPNERGLILHDIGKAKDPNGVKFDPQIRYGRVCIVLSSSPQVSNYVGFDTVYKPKWFHMPTLSKTEFLAIHPNKVQEFEQFGGVLRGVGEDRDGVVEDAIIRFDFSKMSVKDVSEGDSHRLIQVVPDGTNNEGAHIEFLTKSIEERFWKAKWEALKASDMKSLYTKLQSRDRNIYGIPFENYVHEFAKELDFDGSTEIDGTALGSTVSIKGIKPPEKFFVEAASKPKTVIAGKTVKSAVENTAVELERLVTKHMNDEARWICPENRNFPVIDALLIHKKMVFGVQITISDEHQPTTTKLESLNGYGVTFGSQKPGPIHLAGTIFVVDKYRTPLLQQRQTVTPATAVGNVVDAWNDKVMNPQYRLLVSCKEHEHRKKP